MTENELKLGLSGLLKDRIKITPKPTVWNVELLGTECPYDDIFRWIDRPSPRITPLEWLHVCHLVEQSLDKEKHFKFQRELKNVIWHVTTRAQSAERNYVSADWQSRATALLKVLGEGK